MEVSEKVIIGPRCAMCGGMGKLGSGAWGKDIVLTSMGAAIAQQFYDCPYCGGTGRGCGSC